MNRLIKFWIVAFFPLLISQQSAYAFKVEEADTGKTFHSNGGVAVMTLNGATFTVGDVPQETFKLEATDSKKPSNELTANLTLGEPVTMEEVRQVMDWYFKNTAFDYDSIKIRNLKLLPPKYITWCTDYVFFCMGTWQAIAGYVVTYESNGKNRQGGMSGFKPAIQTIHKTISGGSTVATYPATSDSKTNEQRVPLKLGIQFVKMEQQIAKSFGIDDGVAVIIVVVEPDSLAQRSGFRVGDVIRKFGKNAITTAEELVNAVRNVAPGEEVLIEYWRDGNTENKKIVF